MAGMDGKTTNLSMAIDKLGRYLRSSSTRIAAFVGLLSYLSYAFAHTSWANPALIGVSVFVGLFLPSYAKLSNKVELWANNQFGFVTCGRLGRFFPQFAFNLAVFWIMQWGGALKLDGLASVGGTSSAALVTTLASQGTQYFGLYLFQRGIGDANRNVLIGVSVNMVLAAFGTAGVPGAREAFLITGLGLGGLLFAVGLLSDIRSVAAPTGGIGLFFGTFNPFHNTHLDILRRAISQRGLDKVIIHPTLIPRIHADAFRKGELRVARLEDGFQIYETTEKADVNVDYFPSGRMFLPPETRKVLIDLAVAEAGMGDKVEVAFYPETYNSKGFQGVIAEVKRRVPRRSPAHAARNGYRRHDGAPDLRRVRLDLPVAHPAARQRIGDGHPARRQGHDIGCRDRGALATDGKSSRGDGWRPPLPERQRRTDRGEPR